MGKVNCVPAFYIEQDSFSVYGNEVTRNGDGQKKWKIAVPAADIPYLSVKRI